MQIPKPRWVVALPILSLAGVAGWTLRRDIPLSWSGSGPDRVTEEYSRLPSPPAAGGQVPGQGTRFPVSRYVRGHPSYDPIRSGDSDDRGAVFRANIDSANAQDRMRAFRAWQDCGLQYAGNRRTSITSDQMQEIDSNPALDPQRKQLLLASMARADERCKGFAGLEFPPGFIARLLKTAAAEGALSAIAYLQFRMPGADEATKAATASLIISSHNGDALALEYVSSYLVERLVSAHPTLEKPSVQAAYMWAVCQLVDRCMAPSDYLRTIEATYLREFATVEDAYRTQYDANEFARIQALSNAIRIALAKGDSRYFGF